MGPASTPEVLIHSPKGADTADGVGTEWLVDALGCDPKSLSDARIIRVLCERIIVDLDLHTMGGPVVHEFPPPGGITAMFLLSESHLTCHTYPEHGIATFNLYCCRPRPSWAWELRLGEFLNAATVSVRTAVRAPSPESQELNHETSGGQL